MSGPALDFVSSQLKYSSRQTEHDDVEDFGDAGKFKYLASLSLYVERFSM